MAQSNSYSASSPRRLDGANAGRETTCAEIDGLLYLLSRNRPLMTRTTMKPHMLVATAAF